MANEPMNDATQRVPPDKDDAKSTENRQTDPTNKAVAEKVKEDELIDDRFQATDN